MDDAQIKNIEKAIINLERRLVNYEKMLYALIETLDKRTRGFKDLLNDFNDV